MASAALLAALMLAAVSPAPASARQPAFFIVPTWGTLSSPGGWRPDPLRRGVWQHHWGIDIAAPAGTPVAASAPGLVRYAASYGGYGTTIVVEHVGGWATLYGHLQRLAVRPGQAVGRGQVIGTVGASGRGTGPHLHFEIRYRGVPVDPLAYLGR